MATPWHTGTPILPMKTSERENPQVVVEAGIAKFPAGRLPDEARAIAKAAYGRKPTCAVYKIEPATPLDDVNALELSPGATVLFRRGGVWRGQLRVQSGIPGHPIRYGAFGEGPAPVIQPSLDATDADGWRHIGGELWRFDTGLPTDIGNIIVSAAEAPDAAAWRRGCLFKRGSASELLQDGDFTFDPGSGAVILRSVSGNPASRWGEIEMARKLNAIDEPCAHDIEYDGLAIRYAAAHGFGGGGVERIAIRDCDVSWIGGGYLYMDDLGNGVRYGNGIEFWGGAQDVIVENCTVSQCWDAGITNQTNEPGSIQRRIAWRGNRVFECEYSYEFWHQGAGGIAEDVTLVGNDFRDAGFGWGHAQRWNPNAAHLMFYDTTVPTPGFAIRGNVFGRSKNVTARLFNDWAGCAEFSGNRFADGAGWVCRRHGRPRSGLRYLYPDRLDRIHRDDEAEIETP